MACLLASGTSAVTELFQVGWGHRMLVESSATLAHPAKLVTVQAVIMARIGENSLGC